jgi:hypothetical protein
MKVVERERLLVSLFSAVVLHVFIVLLLGLVDLQEDLYPGQKLGPVAVRLQQVPTPSVPEPVRPLEPEPILQETQSPQADEAAAQEASPAPEVGSRSSAAASAAPPQPPTTGTADTSAVRPFWEQPRGEFSGVETGPAEDRRVPSSRDPEQRAVAKATEAPDYGEPVPQRERSWAEESRVITEKPSDTSRVGGGEGAPGTGRETAEPDSVLSEDLRRRIEGISAAGESSGTAGTAGTDGEGRTTGIVDGTAAGEASGSTAGSSADAPFRIEGVQDRELLFYRLPELTNREKAQLPSSIEIAVGFDLMPSGIPANVHLTRGPSTGHPEIDSKIVEAVRSWKFSALPEGSTEEVTGIIRIVIRAK